MVAILVLFYTQKVLVIYFKAYSELPLTFKMHILHQVITNLVRTQNFSKN